MQQDKVIELIRKALALAGSSNEHEAQAAMAKAQELLEKHNLSMGEVQAEGAEEKPEMLRADFHVLGRFRWRIYLIHYICENNFCSTVFSGTDRDKVYILGRAVNVAVVQEMINWVMPQLECLAHTATHKHNAYRTGVSKQRYRDSFLWGCVERIDLRMNTARAARVEVDPNTKALVVERTAEVQAFVEKCFPVLGRGGRTKGAQSFSGYKDGQAAGDKVSLCGSSKQVDNGQKRLGPG